ncbi:MAG: RHS repeat-associated core domain-containing protein [Acidimicrobiales bacterium]
MNSTTTPFVWDLSGGLPLMVEVGTTYYVTGLGGLPVEQITGSTVYYYSEDQLGSTRLLTNSSGTTVAAFSYDPYGKLASSTGTVTTPFGFAGQYTDAESGLIYLRNRYYDPTTSQFITRDPMAALTGSPYTYSGDDPLNAGDPTGLDADCSSGDTTLCDGIDSLVGMCASGNILSQQGTDVCGYATSILEQSREELPAQYPFLSGLEQCESGANLESIQQWKNELQPQANDVVAAENFTGNLWSIGSQFNAPFCFKPFHQNDPTCVTGANQISSFMASHPQVWACTIGIGAGAAGGLIPGLGLASIPKAVGTLTAGCILNAGASEIPPP